MKNKVPKEPRQYINKPLKLNSVPKSENPSDNILVQGADKTVKFITRDELNTAEQVNTDWNSESGLSQLLNKPEFKTINGESVLGEGDITFQDGEAQNLDQVLTEGNATDKTITLFINGANPAAATSVHSLTPYYNIIENRQVNIKSTQFSNAYKIEHTTAPFDQITYQTHFIGMYKDGVSNATYFPSYTNDNGNSAFFPVSVNGNFADKYGNITLSTGGGGDQDLKSVLDKGAVATFSPSNAVALLAPYGSSRYTISAISYNDHSSNLLQFRNQISLQVKNPDGDSSSLSLFEGDLRMTKSNQSAGKTITVNLPLPVGNSNISFPNKPDGDYVLATMSDISGGGGSQDLQSVLTENNRTDKGIKIQQADPSEDAFVSYVVYDSEGINGRGEFGGAYYYSSDGMRISASGGGELTYTSGNRSLEWNADTENPRKTRLSLDRTTDGESVFSFPERDGNFTLVTASDIAVSNNTTTVLSASDLNTAYPIAIVGTQVHCLSITTGAVIYTKTAVGWVQHSVTAVS
jgi:hypothetical protein